MSGIPVELAAQPIPSWARWLAQDEDGTCWAYEAEPNQQHKYWDSRKIMGIIISELKCVVVVNDTQ